MKRTWASKGFTVVEMIVVIVVVVILTTIVTVSYIGFQERARDAERASDIAELQIALDKYYADNSAYPSVCGSNDTFCPASSLETALGPYLESIPHDPSHDENSDLDYGYVHGGTGVNAYGLRVTYEERGTCVTGVRLVQSWWYGPYNRC